jgi:hypothetical protein
MPVDYQKAKIYCIRSPNTDLIYIGATCQQLSSRMAQHRQDIRREKTVTSKVIIEYGDAYIELLENYPCANKEELDKKEGEYIRTQNCCNKFIPDRTKKEYQKQYFEDNKEDLLEQHKQYYQTNKEALLEQKKKYYEDNKEVIAEKDKKYYEANKEVISEKRKEKVVCECGSEVRKCDITSHKKTQKHQNYLKTLTN